jgi:cytochrome c oxidase subunit II
VLAILAAMAPLWRSEGMKRGSWRHAVLAAALAAAVIGAANYATAGAAGQGAVKEFTVVAERYKFTPDHIEVNEGDTVRITVKSADGTHGFAIKKMHVDTMVPKGGEAMTVEFVADKPGSFPITCSEYCGRGHSKMKAVLDVAPAGGHR